MPMPSSRAARGLSISTGSPSISIVPAVGAVVAGEDLEQRRLAGAVLAEQPVDRARLELEVDAVERDGAREPLRDRGHAEDGGSAARSCESAL